MDALQQLAKQRDGLTVYDAGLPRFPRNFTRDGIIAALLFRDSAMMADQVRFCARHQGRQPDTHSGEEVGKIFHEYPGYPLRGKSTQFNGTDTTGLWLFGLAAYVAWSGNHAILLEVQREIDAAFGWIQRHLNEQFVLYENPSHSQSDRFALKVTYWKDSVLIDRPDGEAVWPAVFPLAHVQTMAGLRAVGRLLQNSAMLDMAAKMCDALPLLWDVELGNFYPAIDEEGTVSSVTSDGLHMLAYLERGDVSAETVSSIVASSKSLETELGYQVMSAFDADRVEYDYHAKTVWPFEQAMIHLGATRFELAHVREVCERIIPHIQTAAPETLTLAADLNSKSCDPQLWTLAARHYFANA